MNRDFRERVVLPLLIPLGVVAVIAALVGGFALILLYNTRETAIALATVVAMLILGGVALLTSKDRLPPAKAGVVLLAIVLPLALGVAVATGTVEVAGERNIDRQPHEVIPSDAPHIAAENAESFDTDELTLPAGGEVVLVFENRHEGVPHNVAIYGLKDGEVDQGDEVFSGELITGVDEVIYRFDTPDEGTFAFQCDVHPNMKGTVTFS